VPAEYLTGDDFWWRCESVERTHVVVTPEPSRRLRELETKVKKIQSDFRSEQLGPRVPGSTSVERLTSAAEQLREIERLTVAGAPPGWADLASCWSVPRLRKPVEAAFARIGWSKIYGLVKDVDGWPQELVDLAARKHKQLNTVKKHRPWDPNDYLLRSTK
jgi:hypothetical protein